MRVCSRLFLISAISFIFSTQSAYAYGDYSVSGSGGHHLISVGGGIASPGETTAIDENPAGLVYNTGTKFEASASAEDSNLDPLGLAGLFFFGNGSVGAGLGAQTSTASGSGVSLDYGLAAGLGSSDVSIGLAGTYAITNGGTASGASPWGLNAGAIFNAHGSTRFGATVYDLTNGIGGFGGGAAFDLSPDATLVLDGASDKSFNGKTLKPGLEVRLQPIELAVSYGIDVDDNGGSPISRGTTLGLGVRLTESMHLIGYYNELSKYYLALSVRL